MIDWAHIWTLLGSGVAAAVSGGFAIYSGWRANNFAKEMKELEASLTKEIERQKSEWSKLNAVDIEHLKHQLGINALEHNVRFEKLHERVSITIIRSFKLIIKSYRSLGSLICPIDFGDEPDKDGKFDIARADYQKAMRYVHDNRLLLPVKVFSQLKDFLKVEHTVMSDLRTALRYEKAGVGSTEDKWSRAEKAANELLNPLFDQIHAQMQKALGFSADD